MGVRRGLALTALVTAVVLVGCSDPKAGPLAALDGGGATAGDLLYVGTPRGVTALDVNTAAARFKAHDGVVAPDWSLVFTTHTVGGGTLVDGLDPGTGAVVWSRKVQTPDLVARLASSRGNAVVLGPAAPDRSHPYPEGRQRTKLIVAGAGGARTYDLKGNFEPEALSTDLSTLFVIDYTPASAPVQYRVRRLDLTSGRVHDVVSRDKELQGPMPGTARTQIRSPDGQRLYTLYEVEDLGTAFVHVLDLDEKWAHCIDLPKPFGEHPDGASALAVSPDGHSLYVADEAGGALAHIATQALEVTRTTRLPAHANARDAAAFVGPGDRLYLGIGSRLAAIDTVTFKTVRSWRAPGPVSALEASSDGGYLYAALRRKVAVFTTASRTVQDMIDVPGDDPITSLGSPGLSPERGAIQCAC